MTMLREYAADRLRPLPMLTAASIVAAAATCLAGWRGTERLLVDLALALALTVHFRVWDDFADRHHDAQRHPDRITVRAKSFRSLVTAAVAIAALSAASIVWRDGIGTSTATLMAAWLFYIGWYRWRRDRTAWSDHLLLAKYPVFAFIVAGNGVIAAEAVAALTLLVVYLAFCVYEAWHDEEAPLRRLRIAVEAPLLGSAASALAAVLGGAS